jgi:cytochrome c-type biogenesis protein CcmH
VTLARLEFQAERYEAAARAFERGIAVSRRIAQDPQVWCELADALGMAQGGSLRGKPREAVDRALSLKGNHPRALEMAGSAAIEAGDDERALSYWEPLLVQLDPRSKEYRELRAAIDRIGQRAALGRFGAAPRS